MLFSSLVVAQLKKKNAKTKNNYNLYNLYNIIIPIITKGLLYIYDINECLFWILPSLDFKRMSVNIFFMKEKAKCQISVFIFFHKNENSLLSYYLCIYFIWGK